MHVGIVGGGISGLYAGLLLHRQGHLVSVIESTDRLGGRIYTHRFSSFGSDRKRAYFEAGAMRIPRSAPHGAVFDFVRFLNTHSRRKNHIDFIPYILEHRNNSAFIQGKMRTLDDRALAAELGLPKEYHNASAKDLLRQAVEPWLQLLRKDFDTGFQQVLRHDEISFRQYLRKFARWPHEVVDFVELMVSQTSQFDLSFTEIIMQCLDFGTSEWVTIRGGMSKLIDAAAELLGHRSITCNARVTEIYEAPDGRIKLVTANYDAADSDGLVFDKVLLAIPPAALQKISRRPCWSFTKEQAIRSAHYEPLYKMGLHFRTRFWEKGTRPFLGGQSTTDLRFRWIIFPSNDIGSEDSGVLLLYCWMQDALRWNNVGFDQRVEIALHDLNRFFACHSDPVDIRDQFLEAFDVRWSCDSAAGDAMFFPGQFSRYFEAAKRNEGNIYFAGEHLSRHHTWIAGAIDSTFGAVQSILDDPTLRMLGQEYVPPPKECGLVFKGKNRPTVKIERKIPWKYCIPQHMNVQYI